MAARTASTTCFSTLHLGEALGGCCISQRAYSDVVFPRHSCQSHSSTACFGVRDASIRISRFCLITGISPHSLGQSQNCCFRRKERCLYWVGSRRLPPRKPNAL